MIKPVSTFAIHINSSSYLSYDIINITADTIQNYNFDFGTITMFKLEDLAEFNITPNQINSNKIIDKIEVVAVKYDNIIDFSTPEVYYPTFNYSLKKNQNFTLKYTIKDLNNNSKQNFIENLSIANNTLNHIITY
jgi:dihydrodipicolinate reductase